MDTAAESVFWKQLRVFFVFVLKQLIVFFGSSQECVAATVLNNHSFDFIPSPTHWKRRKLPSPWLEDHHDTLCSFLSDNVALAEKETFAETQI